MLIVDVYNVLHVTGVLPPDLAGPDPAGLGELVARSRYARRGALLVCDGTPRHARRSSPKTGSEPGIRVVYAGGGNDADGLIERLIAEDSAPRRLLVVSDDRRIRTAARRRRAGWLSSAGFLEHLAADATRTGGAPTQQRPASLEPDEVDAWLREFGYRPGSEECSDDPRPDDLDMNRWLDS